MTFWFNNPERLVTKRLFFAQQEAVEQAQNKSWQRVCLFQRTTDRQTDDRKEGQQLTAVLQKLGCSASIDSFFV